MRSLLIGFVVVIANACGDDHLDVPVADSAPPDSRGVPGPVTLTITSLSGPVVGHDVYFQAADSSLVAIVTTDGDGSATAVMEPGGFVTTVNAFGQLLLEPGGAGGALPRYGDDIFTFGGVKPGDHLRLPGHPDRHHGLSDLSMTFTIPIEPLLASVDVPVYLITTSCGGRHSVSRSTPGFPTVTIPLDASHGLGSMLLLGDCNGLVDVAIQTFDHSDGTTNVATLVSYLFAPDIPIVDGGTVDLTASSYSTTYAAMPLALKTNLSSGARFSVSCSLSRNGEVGLSTSETFTAKGSGFEQITLTCPHAPPDSTMLVSTSFSESWQLYWAPYGSDITVDYSDGLGPPDVTFMQMIATRSQGTARVGWRWTLGLDGRARTLPVLPGAISQLNIAPTDSVETLQNLSSKIPGGYDAVREDVLATRGFWVVNPSIGTTGHAAILP